MACLIFASMLLGCNFDLGKKDDFYNYSTRGDLYRIPLIEPYEVVNTGYIDGPWFYYHHGNMYDNTSSVGLNKKDSILILTSSKEWVIVDIPKSKEFRFDDSLEFVNFFSSQYKNSIQVYPCVELFKHYNKTGKWKHRN